VARDLIIAVDGGGTHTTAIAVDRKGAIVGRAAGGPANHVLAPIDVVRSSLREAVGGAIKAAGARPSDVALVAGDTAGIGYLREGADYVEGIISEFFPDVPVYLVGDMVAGFFGALPHEWGVVATAGTGSSIYGRTRQGQSLQAGGWGHILGDEGSAYDIAVGGLRAAARAFDGRAHPTSLVEVFPKHFGAQDMIGVAITIYLDKAMTRDRIAEAARLVAEQAGRGDEAARSVMEAAGRELALAVITVARNLALPPDDIEVSWSGSVFLAGGIIIEPFSRAVREIYSAADIRPPLMPAVGGGVRIACERLGWDFESMRETLIGGLS
jgi:N-acetylglucosamine kinase-like BadF-type ATPase